MFFLVEGPVHIMQSLELTETKALENMHLWSASFYPCASSLLIGKSIQCLHGALEGDAVVLTTTI